MNLLELSASSAAAAIREGKITSSELVRACIEQINAHEEIVGAWSHFDAEHALKQAQEADKLRKSGQPTGALHGIPIGVKDIFDTMDMLTEDGTPLHKGRTPAYDATSVALLRQAGAIIMGKTVTTELAVVSPGKTHNPHNPLHTPGGSSSGSAAAVAAGMVPLAIGTQTNGSVIRPASYCGVVGYKPTHGLISRYRVLPQSRLLDHVGVFARNVKDAALIAQTMMAFDERDPDMLNRTRPALVRTIEEGVVVPPRLAFVKTPAWDQGDDDVKDSFAELSGFLGTHVEEIDMNTLLENVYDAHKTIMEADLAKSFAREYSRGEGVMSQQLREIIENGQRCLATDYNRAVEQIAATNTAMDEILLEYDAILTPSTTGEAPEGLESTGSPVFCTPWSFCGMPAVTLPIMEGSKGLPLGVQLVSSRLDDARLLRTADWLVNKINNAG